MFEEIPSELAHIRQLLGELYEDLPGRAARYRLLSALDHDFGRDGGTMIYGGHAASLAYREARASFVAGNFLATIILSQACLENLLAAFMHAGGVETEPKVSFDRTLQRCRNAQFISETEEQEIRRLTRIRNSLGHFRLFNDDDHVERRAWAEDTHAFHLLESDARFAIVLTIKVLGKDAFALGQKY